MISVSNTFKEAVRSPSKSITAYLTDGSDEITESNDLKTLKITNQADICRSVMRQLDATYFGMHNYLDEYVNPGLGVVLPHITTIGTVTITIASPGVFTKTSHGLNSGDEIKFSTTGTLPTGVVAGTHYFVIKIDANTFNIATNLTNSANNVKVDTSGSQSGVHTLYSYPYGVFDSPEYIDYGKFKVTSLETDQASGITTIKAFDKMYESLQKYDLVLIYPQTLTDFLQAICTRLGWTLETGSDTFPNSTISLTEELFLNSEMSFRDVLDQIAQASASIIYFNISDHLVIKQVSMTVQDTLKGTDLIKMHVDAQYGPINAVTLSRMPQEDNITKLS